MNQQKPLPIRMVCGLGNPGLQYENTRHNAGFMVIDALANRARSVYWKDKFQALVAEVTLADTEIILVKPQSFMNLSGGPIAKLAREYELNPEEILVVHDELDIPEGDLRVKFSGGHAGHNGLRSIIDKFQGNKNFSRLRVGIGKAPGKMPTADFVLQTLKGSALDNIIMQVQDGADIVEFILKNGVLKARDEFNARNKNTLKSE